MSQNICNICGANYEYRNGRWVCPACGAYKTEELSNEEVTLLYNAAQKLRFANFDEAEEAYTDIIEKYPQNPDGYWGRLLSKYGIKYEEDFDGRKIPTCYATSIESVISDKDYLKALELADDDTKEYYHKQAEYIERVRTEWVNKASKEKPYDIFICYKDSDLSHGIERTQDSIDAQDIYIHLAEQGYRVFFSRESLRDKIGEKYEPYIFNALSTAKVMLVYGSSAEYVTSTWLKNEWHRYYKKILSGEKHKESLIVACDGFSPSELPKTLSSRQCLDAKRKTFFLDLDRCIKRIVRESTDGSFSYINREEPIASGLHNHKFKTQIIKSTCISKGYSVHKCDCGYEYRDRFTDLIGHNFAITNNVQPTCTHGGVIEKACTVCGEKAREVLDPLDHDFAEWKIIKDPTCKNPGTRTRHCKRCNFSEIEPIAPIEHEYGPLKTNKDGHLTRVCIHCGKSDYIPSNLNTNNSSTKKSPKRKISIAIAAVLLLIAFLVVNYNIIPFLKERGFIGNDNNAYAPDTEYEITFKGKGGTGYMDSVSAKAGESVTLPKNTFSRTGYTFEGWSSSQNSSVEYADGATIIMGSQSITLYAIWKVNDIDHPNISISFDANGGSGVMTSFKASAWELVTLPQNSFIRKGYTFLGWGTSPNGSVKYLDKGICVLDDASITLYAIWEANTNTITFNANGGSGSMSAQKVPTNGRVYLNKNTFTRSGYIFAGWATSASGSVAYADQSIYTMGTNSNYTLYAIWTKADYKITYHLNGGSNNINNPAGYTVSTNTITLATPTREGYTFLGWYTDSSFRNKITSIPKGSAGDKVLYASWSANTNTINYNANGGSGTVSGQQIKTGESAYLKENFFTREGYTFKGWSTAKNGSVEYSNRAYYTMGTSSSVTLYAIWEANTNIINFNANGGSGTMSSQTGKTGETIFLKANTFTRSGYIFAGWATSASGTVKYTNQSSYTISTTSSVTLYAVWTSANASYSVGLEYLLNDEGNSYSVTGIGTCADTDIVIPSTYNGLPVTSIGKQAFYYCPELLTSVTIGDSVVSIGESAFWGSYSLISVTLGKSVESIGEHAFSACYKLIEVCNKSSLSITKGSSNYGDIGYYAKKIIVDKSQSALKEKGDYIFYDDGTSIYLVRYMGNETEITLPSYDDGKKYQVYDWLFKKNDQITSIIIPNCVTKIGGYAFYDCTSLKSINIPNSVISFGDYAFRGCTSLSNITLPNSMTVISDRAFAGCSSLVSISVPGSINSIKDYSLSNCTLLTSINFGGTISQWNGISKEIYWNNSTGNYTIYCTDGQIAKDGTITYNPSSSTSSVGLAYTLNADGNSYSVTGIGTCTDSNVVIPSTYNGKPVTTVGNSAFQDCISLISVTIPNSVTSIGTSAFSGCTALTKISIPDSITSVGGSAFSTCDALQYNTYGNANYLGNNSNPYLVLIKGSNTSITSCSIPSGTQIIYNGAFSSCRALTNISVDTSNQYFKAIDGNLYSKDGKTIIRYAPGKTATSFKIPNTVTNIGTSAFTHSTSLAEVIIPVSVTKIGSSAFNGCSNLMAFYYEGTVAEWKSISKSSIWGILENKKRTVYCTDGQTDDNGSECVTPDTLVTLADGTQKEIQYITYDDQLLVWNFYTGKYDIAPSSIVMNHGYDWYTITSLTFEDGTTVNTINGHGFFDTSTNEYVIIDCNNVTQYVGHEFVNVDGDGYSTTKLVSYNIYEEYTESWSILTTEHYNCILENMWTLTPAEVEGSPDYLMPFEIGEGMKYDEAKMQDDIEMYGLYTYDDFDEYCTYEEFVGFGFDIFKVSVGKGAITFDEILYLISIHLG